MNSSSDDSGNDTPLLLTPRESNALLILSKFNHTGQFTEGIDGLVEEGKKRYSQSREPTVIKTKKRKSGWKCLLCCC